jgi:hypothetical protein
MERTIRNVIDIEKKAIQITLNRFSLLISNLFRTSNVSFPTSSNKETGDRAALPKLIIHSWVDPRFALDILNGIAKRKASKKYI